MTVTKCDRCGKINVNQYKQITSGLALIIMNHDKLRRQTAALNAALTSSMAAYDKLRTE